jgi:hypothetical protein
MIRSSTGALRSSESGIANTRVDRKYARERGVVPQYVPIRVRNYSGIGRARDRELLCALGLAPSHVSSFRCEAVCVSSCQPLILVRGHGFETVTRRTVEPCPCAFSHTQKQVSTIGRPIDIRQITEIALTTA